MVWFTNFCHSPSIVPTHSSHTGWAVLGTLPFGCNVFTCIMTPSAVRLLPSHGLLRQAFQLATRLIFGRFEQELPMPFVISCTLGGVFAQRRHSANYYTAHPGSTPANHPPTEACMMHSKQHRGCRIQGPGTRGKHQTKTKKIPGVPAGAVGCRLQDPGIRGYRWWKTADFSHSARTAHGAPPLSLLHAIGFPLSPISNGVSVCSFVVWLLSIHSILWEVAWCKIEVVAQNCESDPLPFGPSTHSHTIIMTGCGHW